ncbi:MAG TPA: hypothetical protein VIV40_40995 [Kofleriaceae bacterium]
MKGDIAFVGFMLTADEWQELDAQSRAQLIAVATRRTDPPPAPRRFPEGTGKHEVIDVTDVIDPELDAIEDELECGEELLDLDALLELDPDDVESNLEPISSSVVDDELVTADLSVPDGELEDFADWAEL